MDKYEAAERTGELSPTRSPRKLAPNLRIFKMIREAEDLMIKEVMEGSRMPRSQSLDDILRAADDDLAPYSFGKKSHRNDTDPKGVIYNYLTGKLSSFLTNCFISCLPSLHCHEMLYVARSCDDYLVLTTILKK